MIALLVSVAGCKKNNDENPDDVDIELTTENATAEVIINDVTNIADLAYNQNSTAYKDGFPYSNCATLSFDTTVIPNRIVIDFGEENCLCTDLRYRRGKIYVAFSGGYFQAGSFRNITTENYFVNDNQVLLDKTVTTEGLNNSGNYYFTIVEECTINWSEGGSLHWESERGREWIEGSTTILNIFDDVYLISGSASGTRPDGQTYTQVITNPLRVEISCSNIVSGTVDITPEGKPVRTLDYGDGICDRIATVTVLGYTFTILLW